MLARCLPSILPPLTREEAIQVTQIHSALDSCHQNGKRAQNRLASSTLLTSRPFRAPHQSISAAGLVGGGTRPVPGEISFAHRGVLFLDEFVEFRRDVIECLRQPLENREVALMRAQFRLVFPADFILLAAMNPCPCGMRGVAGRQCICSPGTVRRYLGKVSGPILDRIDLQVWVPTVPISELNGKLGNDPTSEVRERIKSARLHQRERLQREAGLNATMRPREIRANCAIDSAGKRFLETAADKLRLSARGYSRVLKVARTIADLEQSEAIALPHLSEALSYRLPGEFG
jgi:magnesium chelatase family protein